LRRSNKQLLIEQAALLFTSLVWTIVVLAAIALYWAYQDVQARWDDVLSVQPEALAQAAPTTATPTPTATVWSPPPTLTPAPTKLPTPTATWVIPPPEVLPETFPANPHQWSSLSNREIRAPLPPRRLPHLPYPPLPSRHSRLNRRPLPRRSNRQRLHCPQRLPPLYCLLPCLSRSPRTPHPPGW